MALRVALVAEDAGVRGAMARAFQGAPPDWEVTLHDVPPQDADVVVAGPEFESVPGIRFDCRAPQRALEEVEAAVADRPGRTYVVTAAVGGAGTTTLALHLAASLAGTAPTCVLDLDARGGVAARLGLADDHLTWREDGSVPVAGGFRALPSPEDARPDEFAPALERAAAVFERVVVDAPDREALEVAARAARAAVLVLTPTVPSALRSRALLDRHTDCNWAIVSNRTGPGGELLCSELEDRLAHRVALELPCSPALRDAEDDCRLLAHRWTRYLRGVRTLAERLELV
ncbi:MAG: division plane positioning ATPase MipZ [Actinomycetota bacterium]